MKVQFKIIFTIVILFCVFVFFSSCESNEISEPANKVVCVLFDLSETTNTQEMRANYLEKFKMILGRMNPGDAIEAALITEKSVSELNLSIEHTFKKFAPATDNELLIKAQKRIADSLLQAEKELLIKTADSVLFKPSRKIMQTEILSSLQVAERIFNAFPQPRKVLVIFSDMIEESSLANFARRNITDSTVDEIIKKQKENGTFPDLKNVKVYVAGAYHTDTKKFNQIRNFWFRYLEETGADIQKHNYGAALIRFEE